MDMTLLFAEALDIRARARMLQQLLKWEDEGAVVERCVFSRPSYMPVAHLDSYISRIYILDI